MAIIFDPGKNERNIEERGLSFELVEKLEWNSALIKEDIRRDYGEIRLQVFALLDDRLYAVVVLHAEKTSGSSVSEKQISER